jgi:FdhE protein
LKPPQLKRVQGRIGDPTRETVGQPLAIILPEPSRLFVRRAERLDSLAQDHPMSAWLRFMANIARAQHRAAAALPAAQPSAVTEGVAPLTLGDWQTALLEFDPEPDMPDAASEALLRLRTRNLDALADAYLQGTLRQEETGEAVYVAAALAVHFAHRAAALPLHALHLLPERGHCPACGSLPVAGVITAAGQAPGARYLHCGLCGTAWNHVRAVCITCGESRGLKLLSIEGGNGVVQAEACDDCHSYAKMLYEANDMQVEAMADDLASLGLDLLVSEAGYFRHAPNPMIITAGTHLPGDHP